MNKIDSATRRLFQDPIKRRAWTKYQIHMQGTTMASIAEAAGVKRSTLYMAFCRPYPRMEKIIANAVGLTPQVLFPERYDGDGLPNRRMGRPRKSAANTAQNTTPRPARNVQTDGGA